MEALIALGLAANIGQFVGYGLTLVAKGKEIHSSTKGATKENVDREVIAKHLRDTLSKIQPCPQSVSSTLEELRKKCVTLIEELLGALDDLKVKGRPRKWKSARQALKVARSKDKVEGWENRLTKFKDAFQLQVFTQMSETIELSALKQDDSFQAAFQKLDTLQQQCVELFASAMIHSSRNELVADVLDGHTALLQQIKEQHSTVLNAMQEQTAYLDAHETRSHLETRRHLVEHITAQQSSSRARTNAATAKLVDTVVNGVDTICLQADAVSNKQASAFEEVAMDLMTTHIQLEELHGQVQLQSSSSPQQAQHFHMAFNVCHDPSRHLWTYGEVNHGSQLPAGDLEPTGAQSEHGRRAVTSRSDSRTLANNNGVDADHSPTIQDRRFAQSWTEPVRQGPLSQRDPMISSMVASEYPGSDKSARVSHGMLDNFIAREALRDPNSNQRSFHIIKGLRECSLRNRILLCWIVNTFFVHATAICAQLGTEKPSLLALLRWTEEFFGIGCRALLDDLLPMLFASIAAGTPLPHSAVDPVHLLGSIDLIHQLHMTAAQISGSSQACYESSQDTFFRAISCATRNPTNERAAYELVIVASRQLYAARSSSGASPVKFRIINPIRKIETSLFCLLRCPLNCLETFLVYAEWCEHVASHDMLRKQQRCTYTPCSSKLNSGYDLAQHVLQHTMPFACDTCLHEGRLFRGGPSQLRDHTVECHSITPGEESGDVPDKPAARFAWNNQDRVEVEIDIGGVGLAKEQLAASRSDEDHDHDTRGTAIPIDASCENNFAQASPPVVNQVHRHSQSFEPRLKRMARKPRAPANDRQARPSVPIEPGPGQWTCHNCGVGMMNIALDSGCHDCGHKRCSECPTSKL